MIETNQTHTNNEGIELISAGNKQGGMLMDVAIIRPLLVLLLVFYHAFAPYSGAWEPIEGYPEIPLYWWLDKFSFAFMLEMFVFVSGYVFGYQVRTKGDRKLAVKSLFWGKFKRLIIPSLVFSLLYILLFKNIAQPVTNTLYDIINGVGHMWFLPMLFWCFIVVWVIEKIHLNRYFALIALLICSLIPLGGLPLQLSKTMYYMFFFYVGYSLQRYDLRIECVQQLTMAIWFSVAFFLLFPSLTLLKENVGILMGGGENQQITNLVSGVVVRLCQLMYSSVGIAMVMSFVRNSLQIQIKPLPEIMVEVGSLCMGVYLLQQFILNTLYRYTLLPSVLGPYILPWVGFIITLVISVLITYFMRKTVIGKFLIG